MKSILLLAALAAAAQAESKWLTFYDNGFQPGRVGAWTSPLTSSRRTPEGLRIVDLSTKKGSGRCFHFNWNIDPKKGAEVEARLKTISCSALWGVVLVLADGEHEEGVTFFPDRVALCYHPKVKAAFPCADGFHTYRIVFKAPDIRVYADGRLLLDGKGQVTRPAPGKRNRVSFGSASSHAMGESIWKFVRCRGVRVPAVEVQAPRVPGLEVVRGATQIIVPGRRYIGMFKFRNGDICVDGKRSSDGGLTWRNAPGFSVSAYEFPDGEIVQIGFMMQKTGRPGYFTLPLWRSTDAGKTRRKETALLHIPDAVGGVNDLGKPVPGPACDHSIIQLRDGSLLAACYGQFKTDKVLCPAFPPAWKFYKYRSFVVRSTDRGKTWSYWATVAYDPSVGIESFCEPDLLTLPNGDILCFMRTGGARGRYSPMHMSRSRDDGRTWSKPRPIADRGVWPNACRMRNGVLVVTYGRPGNWLAFSLDDGRTWVGHFCFYAGGSTCYNTVEEVAPGKLLVVYDRRRLDAAGELRVEEVGTFFSVRRR